MGRGVSRLYAHPLHGLSRPALVNLEIFLETLSLPRLVFYVPKLILRKITNKVPMLILTRN